VLAPIALALASLGGGDTPVEPIESDLVETFIEMGDESMTAVCDAYPDAVEAFGNVIDDQGLARDIVDGWAIDMFEGGYSPDHSAHFTVEARVVFLSWLHNC
jgi:hypothetical protein